MYSNLFWLAAKPIVKDRYNKTPAEWFQQENVIEDLFYIAEYFTDAQNNRVTVTETGMNFQLHNLTLDTHGPTQDKSPLVLNPQVLNHSKANIPETNHKFTPIKAV